MTVATDEPVNLCELPWTGGFWHRGRWVPILVGPSRRRLTHAAIARGEYNPPRLDGQFGRDWIADPCGSIRALHEHRKQFIEKRGLENAADKAERIARARERMELQVEEAEAKRRGRRRR